MNYFRKMQLHYLHGGNLIVLIRLLIDNKFVINIRQIPKVLILLISNIINIPFILLQKIFFLGKVEKTKIEKDPVFILGHWRSGTTFLSNLITRDNQFGYFNILQTYHPSTYIFLKPVLHFFGKKVIPKQRPMDNIKVALDLPQEEDYAVANRSLYSMVHFIAFPRNFNKYYYKFGLFEGIGKNQFKSWRRIYLSEIKKATYVAGGRQLVIKTPINTGRIKEILGMFPNAKFIHISRNPYKTCLSTQKLYKNFFPLYDLQYMADDDELEETQLNVYEALYKKYFEQKNLIPEGNLIEIKYESFIKEPLKHIKNIYTDLGLSGYEEAEKEFKAHIDAEKQYTPNSYSYDEKKLAKIKERLSFAFEGLDYPKDLI
ncbi:MAG: sulfotransferase [Clostridia bacterium]|nr:sulfotransferase [Clostridia bacterium]